MKKFAVLMAVALGGCATYIPVEKTSGNFSLSYASTAQQGAPLPAVVAFVAPEFPGKDVDKSNTMTYQVSIPSFAGMATDKTPFVAAAQFQARYKQEVSDALQNALEDMYQKRGFKTKGPYETYDDISFVDKKAVYLISEPKLTLYFDQTVTKTECHNGGQVCHTEGNFKLRGELLYRLVEPMTGQSLMTKRFDIGQLNIEKKYVKEIQFRTLSNGLAGALLDKMIAPDKLIDTTDQAMSEAISQMFAQVTSRLDNALSRDEILGYKTDIAQLKSMKQY